MIHVRAITDLNACRKAWETCVPTRYIADLWDVRECFQTHYRREPYFVIAEDDGVLKGFLPLSWIPEMDCFGYFPGETWHNETWLEQNRIVADSGRTLEKMFDFLNKQSLRFQLRYLSASTDLLDQGALLDENGYLFHPPRFDYDLESFFDSFSRKAGKKILKVVEQFDARGIDVRLDCLADFDRMVQMNLDRYGLESYFADHRFTEAFRDLMLFFQDRGWLRMTTILVEGKVAAVDMGCMFQGAYTLLAGGTNPDFLGIAKYINLYHMRRACRERLDEVDFLCGDFGWKPMFHLAPRPLYKFSNFDLPAYAIDAETVEPALQSPNETPYEKSDA